MLNELWNLFIGFLRASNLGFGGGPALIPLIQAEANRYSWLSNADFADALAVGNALPGPIATKMATYIGYHVASWPGVLVAVLATIGPTCLAVILLSKVLMKYANSPGLKAMLKGVRPVVTVLIALVAYNMALSSFIIKSPLDFVTVLIAAVAAACLYFFKVHPVFLIVGSMVIGYFVF